MSIINTISGVSSAVNIGGSALSLIGMGKALVTLQPKEGIEGFLFDMPLTENVTLNANITDHYTEENSSIQDHIAFDPIKITITGKVAELVYTKLAGLAFLSAMIDRLTPLGLLSPEQSLKAMQAMAAVNKVNETLGSLKKTFTSLKSVFDDTPAKNNQQKAFTLFQNYFESRSLLSVQTPWKTFTNMAIESFVADQDESSLMESTFTLTFKEMRFVSTQTYAGSLVGRIAAQKSDIVNKATQSGQKQTAAKKIANFVGGIGQ